MKKVLLKTIGTGLNLMAHVSPRKTGQVGFELFCRPFRTPITEKQNEFFNSATKSSFELAGNRIQTYRWGTGEKKVLLLHGWQSHTYRWKIYIEALSKNYTVHGLDAPGHGLSTGHLLNVPLYSQVIEEYVKQIGELDAIITHSLGGFAAFYTFYRNPLLGAKKMVALASPGEAQEFFDFYTQSLKLSAKSIKLISNRFEELFQQLPSYFSAPIFASTLTIPGLIIHDADDKETPFYHAERIHQSWKNSKLIKTQGLGHNLKSTDIVKEVIQFVNDPIRDYNPNQIQVTHHN
jgi:pimeloyl-ACP methyl ester carboxylesterase